jgi:hypothetical protein
MTARRVVTGIDANGKSFAVHDGPTTGHMDLGMLVLDDVWVDDPANPDPNAQGDPVEGANALVPPEGGSSVRILTLMPASRSDMPDSDALVAAAARFDFGGVIEEGAAGEEGWHTTATIDYGIVLSGHVELGLDSGWVEMGPGDVVVQRATRHAWRLVGAEPARVAFVLIASPNYQ